MPQVCSFPVFYLDYLRIFLLPFFSQEVKKFNICLTPNVTNTDS